MGQAYSLTTLSAGSAGIDVPELADLAYEKSLGDARFMKTIRARHSAGLVVAKVIVKPYSSMKLDKYIAAINRERKSLEDVPNTLTFHRAFETNNYGYLLRQYTYSSLYDRMSTRPFLEDVEKRWLAFQLLTAVKECHNKDMYHGDIKTENSLVTSWNWLFLSDFSGAFKPVYLPEDDPAEFSFYFDISGRRTCYLAPERFLKSGQPPDPRAKITWAMDIFSVGCVIAELFCEGPIFNLSQLFNYRTGTFNPMKEQINRIEDPEIRELVGHMIQLEPESRYSADEYLNFWRGKAFPEYFYSFLHQYMFLITDPSSGKAAITADKANLGESDDRIARVYHDFDKISYFLGYNDSSSTKRHRTTVETGVSPAVFPLHVDLPHRRQITALKSRNAGNDGTYLLLNIVTSSMRSTARATARLQACDLLLAFAEHVPDEAKLDRILPFVLSLLDDRSDIVKVAALRTLAQLLSIITTPSPVNAYVFPEYLIPRLNEVLNPKRGKKPDAAIRTAYAQCIAPIAETAARFLDSIQALRREGSLPSVDPDSEESHVLHAYQDYYDIARGDLVRFFEAQSRSLLTDGDSGVRRAFLGSISSLCLFFGSSKTNDAILSHLNTYLNDRDWKLRCAFFDAIVGVAIYVGSSNLEDFILPLMTLALTDSEEFVIERAIRSLAKMAELGLFQRSKLWSLIDLTARYTMHPNSWIREAAASFVAKATKFLTVADIHCLVRPLLAPYLRMMPSSFTEAGVLDVLQKPLPRPVYAAAKTWAERAEHSVFWKTLEQRANSTRVEDNMTAISSKELTSNAFQKFPKSDEDQQWTKRLRDTGLDHEDEFKLLALSESIWRITKRTSRDAGSSASSAFDNQFELDAEQLKEVSFEVNRQDLDEPQGPTDGDTADQRDKPQTIENALLDASTTIGEQESRRGMTQPVSVVVRESSQKSGPGLLRNKGFESDYQSDQASSPGSGASTLRDAPGQIPVRPKSSAMNLMQRANLGGKAGAETGTTSENAFGLVDGNSSREDGDTASQALAAGDMARRPTIKVRYKPGSGYKGRDPNVLKLLGSIYMDSVPTNMAEFGSNVKPIEEVLLERKNSSKVSGIWRPTGIMIATFNEHARAITSIIVAPDHSFFITASEDGSAKVWDTSRLERNLAHRSRQTYKLAADVKITSMCFIGNTLSFVITANDGSIHIVRVDRDQSTARYSKLRQIRQWHVPNAPSCHVVWTQCVSTGTSTFLFAATTSSLVHAMDLRSGAILYTLENPLQHGTLTTFCVGPNPHHWLLVGTSNGVLDLWDLRFRLRLRSFAFPGASPIHRISLHPGYNDGAFEPSDGARAKNTVYVSGGTGAGDITAWDLQEMKCIEVYRSATVVPGQTLKPEGLSGRGEGSPRRETGSSAVKVNNLDLRPYTPWNPDTAPRSTLLERFNPSSQAGNDNGEKQDAPNTAQTWTVQAAPDRGCRAMFVGTRDDGPGPGAPAPYIITGGPSSNVRFWDLKDERSLGQSCILSGTDDEDEATTAPIYEVVGRKNGTVVCEERYPKPENDEGRAPNGKDAKDKRRKERPKGRSRGLGRELLLQRHLDAVTDVAVIELPYRMIVSGDRSGVVFVWA